MARPPALLCIALLCVTPAAACSGYAPTGGEFHIYDVSSHHDWVVPTHVGSYGAACEFIGENDYDGRGFAYLDNVDGRRGIYFVASEGVAAKRLAIDAPRIHDIDLDGDFLSWHYYNFDQGSMKPATSRVHVYNITTGVDRVSPLRSSDPYETYYLEDRVAVWIETYLNVYDLESDAWILHNETWTDLGVPGSVRSLSAAGDGWVILSGGREHWAVNWTTRASHNLTTMLNATRTVGVSAGRVYWTDGLVYLGAARTPLHWATLPAGAVESSQDLPYQVVEELQVQGGRVVLGVHRHDASPTPTTVPTTTSTGSDPPMDSPDDGSMHSPATTPGDDGSQATVPAPAWISLAALAVALATMRRR